MSIRSIEAGGGWRAGARWGAAAIIVLVAHMTGAWIIAQQQTEATAGDTAPAIMVELAPLPMAPSAEPIDMAPGPEISEVQPEPVTEAREREIDMPPPPEPAEPTFDSAELQPPPPPTPEPEVVLPEPPKKQPVTEEPLRPEVKRRPAPRPRQPDERQGRKQAKPQSKVATAPPRPQATAAALAAPAPGAAPSASASPANWRGALLAHLNRAKRYPFEARQKREEGTVRLSFSIDRSGRVVSYRIAGSSGSIALDQEALAMIQRASPLPAPPPEIGGAYISLTVPVRFNIN